MHFAITYQDSLYRLQDLFRLQYRPSESGLPSSAENILIETSLKFALAHEFFQCGCKALMVRHIGIDIASRHGDVDQVIRIA